MNECKTKILINPPPQDMKCECCGKHIDELKPFGKEGDPLKGDFNGSKLVKIFRGYDTEHGRNVYASWECRDCIILNEDDYYNRCEMFKKVKK